MIINGKCISSHGCFPVKSPNYFSAEAPSKPLLILPFKVLLKKFFLFSMVKVCHSII